MPDPTSEFVSLSLEFSHYLNERWAHRSDMLWPLVSKWQEALAAMPSEWARREGRDEEVRQLRRALEQAERHVVLAKGLLPNAFFACSYCWANADRALDIRHRLLPASSEHCPFAVLNALRPALVVKTDPPDAAHEVIDAAMAWARSLQNPIDAWTPEAARLIQAVWTYKKDAPPAPEKNP